MSDLPNPVTRDQTFLAAVVGRLDRQNDLLTDIRDRLPTPSEGQPAADHTGVSDGPQGVEITEPAVPARGETVPLAEPAQPAKRPPAKKPAAKRTTTARAATTKRS